MADDLRRRMEQLATRLEGMAAYARQNGKHSLARGFLIARDRLRAELNTAPKPTFTQRTWAKFFTWWKG